MDTIFSLTNFIILLLWLLFLGSWGFVSIDLSDKNLEKTRVSENFKNSAKVVRKRFRRIKWITIIIFSIVFLTFIHLFDKNFIDIVIIGVIALGLVLIPPIGNASKNLAAMIIAKIYSQSFDELTKK